MHLKPTMRFRPLSLQRLEEGNFIVADLLRVSGLSRAFSPTGGATMKQPDGGFSQAPLASLFNDKIPVAAGTTTPSSTGSHSSHSNVHVASIVGALVGIIALAVSSVSLGFFYRRRIQQFLIGGHFPFQELDINQRDAKEIMGLDVCWELSVNEKPVEL